MEKWKKTRKYLGLGVLAMASLSACGEKPLDYSGEYEVLMGQDCAMVSELGDSTFLEIAHTVEGDNSGYLVRFPLAVEMGFPGFSSSAAPDEKGVLTAFFVQGTDGVMGYKSEASMAMSLTPHATLPDHLWLTRWEVESQNNLGASEKKNVLDSMIQPMNAELRTMQGQFDTPLDLSNQVMCLGKKNRLSEAERTALKEAAKLRLAQAQAEELDTLRAMPFGEFWSLRDACKSAMTSPRCHAFSTLSQERIEAERKREISRLSAMSDEDLAAVGATCQGTGEPRCHAYYHTLDERKNDAKGQETTRLEAMDYETFVKEESVVCGRRWSTQCQAYTALKDPKRGAELNRLVLIHGGQALVELESGACTINNPKQNRDLDLCDLMRDATSQKRQEQVAYYADHRDELREDYNGCFEEFHALRNARKSKEALAVKASFVCLTAFDGARAAGVRGQFKDKM
jgi:hypothetical protein